MCLFRCNTLLSVLQTIYFQCLHVFWLCVKYFSQPLDEATHIPWGSIDSGLRTAAIEALPATPTAPDVENKHSLAQYLSLTWAEVYCLSNVIFLSA
jgi:hypothetical protein